MEFNWKLYRLLKDENLFVFDDLAIAKCFEDFFHASVRIMHAVWASSSNSLLHHVHGPYGCSSVSWH